MILLNLKLLFQLIGNLAYCTVYWSDIIEYPKCLSHYRGEEKKKKEKSNRYKKQHPSVASREKKKITGCNTIGERLRALSAS